MSSTVRETDRVRIENAPLVFVGYGVNAPERGWDDFGDVDLHGKIAVFLVNDPDFEAAPGEPVAGRFGGRAMTYYGRWTYKYEEAARRGAIGALVIHETDGAGYGWNTVQAPAGETTMSCSPPNAPQPVLLQGWIQRDVAVDLFRRAGLDFEAVKRQARSARLPPDRPRRDLLGRPAGDQPAGREPQRHRPPARRAPSRRDDHVLRPLGRLWHRPAPTRAATRSATAPMTTRSASPACSRWRALFAAGPRPQRTLLFAAWTAEERGLLGSEYEAANPLYPGRDDGREHHPRHAAIGRAGARRDPDRPGPERPRGPDGADGAAARAGR